jgi:hypothetical protein
MMPTPIDLLLPKKSSPAESIAHTSQVQNVAGK